MGDHLRLLLGTGDALVLWQDDDGKLRAAVEDFAGERVYPDDPAGMVVFDELGLARLAVWSRDQLRRQR